MFFHSVKMFRRQQFLKQFCMFHQNRQLILGKNLLGMFCEQPWIAKNRPADHYSITTRSSWINTLAGSLDSASMPEPSMVSHFAGCSTAPCDGNPGCQNTSAPTRICFIGLGSGKPICGYWKCPRSK